MTLLSLLVVLIVLWLLLWLVRSAQPTGSLNTIITVVLVLAVVVWCLESLGWVDFLTVPIGRHHHRY